MIEIPAPYNLAYIHKETKAYIGKVLRLGSLDDFWKYELIKCIGDRVTPKKELQN